MSIASAREKAGLSQRALAEKLHVSAAAVALWDTGKTMPRASLLLRLAEVCGCSVEELLQKEDAKSS